MNEDAPCTPAAPGPRGTAARLAGLSLVSLISLALPQDGVGRPSVAIPLPSPSLDPNLPFSTLRPGWPGPVPDLANEAEERAWTLVARQCERFGIPDQALAMYHVLWEESRCLPHVRSASGRYHGIGQFVRSTFRVNVRRMKELGLISEASRYSPMNPEQAIEVMAWMWSQGYPDHWGPYRRVSRRLAAAARQKPVPVLLAGPDHTQASVN